MVVTPANSRQYQLYVPRDGWSSRTVRYKYAQSAVNINQVLIHLPSEIVHVPANSRELELRLFQASVSGNSSSGCTELTFVFLDTR